MPAAIFSILFACLVVVSPAFASGGGAITLPASGAIVSGPVPISIVPDPRAAWTNFYVDGGYLASTPPLTLTWNSTTVPNGAHTISVTAYTAGKFTIGKTSIAVTVANPVQLLKLSSPISGSQVSGSITISANQPPGVVWENFYVDGGWIKSTPPASFSWNTNQIANGPHTISVVSYDNSGKIGADSLSITVANGTAPQGSVLPTPTTVPTVASTPVPTIVQTAVPTIAPTPVPTVAPTTAPTLAPTAVQTVAPTPVPTVAPTTAPTVAPTAAPTIAPTVAPTTTPTAVPTIAPTAAPTIAPTVAPTATPTAVPTVAPTAAPTIAPTVAPTTTPTAVPTVAPTAAPTIAPTVAPTATPTAVSTVAPTAAPTIAPTVVPTATPTAVPTVAPTVAPTTVPTIAPTAVSTTTPTASPTPVTTAAFFVSPAGSDGNNGMSPANAWRTVQHAVNSLPAGETVMVAQGTYNERVSIVRDDVTVQADPDAASTPVVAQGFDIRAKNVTVDGFEISFQNNGTPGGYGIHIHDSSNVVVQNNYIHDLCHEGVMLEATVSNIQVLNNTIVHAQMTGINIDGTGDLIQGNEIWGTYQHPSVLGGIFAGCTNDGGSGADADIIRFFGSNHIIRSNYGHDIQLDHGNTGLPNPSPHIDCFQTWGASGESTNNILIDGNLCRWSAAQGEVSSIEALNGPVGNITFQNNIFQNMVRGVNATRDGGQVIGQLNFYNNTFDHLLAEAIFVDGARSDNVVNNIFYDIVGGDGFISYATGENFLSNVFYTRAGAPSGGRYWGGGATPAYQAINPLFVNTGDSTGLGADYHLCIAGQNGCTATSTIGHSGATLASVLNDYDGNLRSDGYSIGAQQMK